MDSWIHDRFSDSRWISEKFLVPTPSVAEDLTPRDIVSSEPRHWMVFGQLVMLVQCCVEAPAAMPHRSSA